MTGLGFERINVEDGSLETNEVYRSKLPHGWLVVLNLGSAVTFVPFSEDGTGWGKNDTSSRPSPHHSLFGLNTDPALAIPS